MDTTLLGTVLGENKEHTPKGIFRQVKVDLEPAAKRPYLLTSVPLRKR